MSTDHSTYDVEQRDRMPDLGPLQLVGEEDDVFLYKSKSQTTEDLFTIIHRLISAATKYSSSQYSSSLVFTLFSSFFHFAGLKESSWVVKTPLKISKVTLALRHSAAELPRSVLKMTTSWLFWEGREVPRLVAVNESPLQSSSEAPSPQLPLQQTSPTAKIAMYSHTVHKV